MAARNINTKEFQELLAQDKPILVDFWAPWCGYCRRIGPAYDRVADQYGAQVEIVKINIDEEALLANEQQIDVIPTLILYKNGERLDSVIAPPSKAAIDDFLQENLAK